MLREVCPKKAKNSLFAILGRNHYEQSQRLNCPWIIKIILTKIAHNKHDTESDLHDRLPNCLWVIEINKFAIVRSFSLTVLIVSQSFQTLNSFRQSYPTKNTWHCFKIGHNDEYGTAAMSFKHHGEFVKAKKYITFRYSLYMICRQYNCTLVDTVNGFTCSAKHRRVQ